MDLLRWNQMKHQGSMMKYVPLISRDKFFVRQFFNVGILFLLDSTISRKPQAALDEAVYNVTVPTVTV